MKKRMMTVIVTACAVLGMTVAVSAEEASYSIAASHGYGAVQHWEIKTVGMQDAAEEFGAEFTYKYADGDLQQEVDDIENFVEMGVDYIIVGPCNSEGIVPVIEEAQSKGVAIGTCDIGIEGVDVASFVSSDNYGIGQIAADFIGEQMGGEGQIAILTWPAASATADRAAGFMDKLKESWPNIEIVAEQDCNADRSASLSAAESIIQANPDIQFIWGANAEMALGAYSATQSLNRTDIKVVAVDTDSEVMEAVANGTNLVATVSQDPYTMGYKAVENAIKYLNGEEVEDAFIECELVTAENCADIVARDNAYLEK
ncbi:sugar ABC transporter substrate-binding protein [Porcincola intestinalis]|uniref:Sugar ABC transporter substrate-binding protein n=1 Tax=Porcincola intestinalis TaxID=2606632 RepID=A0A6L5X8P1_9FIRM|nr:sugar ABC transporter substrate-binding protein [Porcincola intestinalis]MCI6766806.1 sugar ABC transporter substrate-binding protein [Lachnospiraceae bacterium]MDD7059231.1 sugar ABC transporter substrate-binding protein [Porcincola intestinalis]MDY5284165.1 sugar ABC transporter substrate-binding protein [Porcincola intestinalis]MSS15738.1 sugar ABC transporter substrate-binding protein [Porcincola intestinalis]